MLGRHVYRVSGAKARWEVTKDGEPGPRGKFATRDAAVRAACDLAEADAPSRVTVENTDGTLDEEATFGSDPADVPSR
jgi:hypothetical protein